MDSTSSNDDDEPKVCTVFASSSNDAKSVFDTIAFSVPKKESPTTTQAASAAFLLPPSNASTKQQQSITPTTGMSKTSSMISVLADDLQSGDTNLIDSSNFISEDTARKIQADQATIDKNTSEQALNNLQQNFEQLSSSLSTPSGTGNARATDSLTKSVELDENTDDLALPPTKDLFADAPEVAFPVSIGYSEPVFSGMVSGNQKFEMSTVPKDQLFLSSTHPSNFISTAASLAASYDCYEASYDAWISSEEAKSILITICTQPSGTYIPDKSNMTMPGIIHDEDFVDKVTVNMARVFGENEANKRKILTADSVTQDENGLRELIKLGCYRAALNLTKRLLTLCGQGAGKVGHYSKHSPHTLQLWFTRISLLVRIREFAIAESEVLQFNDFEKPDMYYEYYPDSISNSSQRKGSMVPFNFRLLAAEIPQYMRKFNETTEKLVKLLFVVNQILQNLETGLHEDGSVRETDNESVQENTVKSLGVWKARRIRIMYSLANASLFSKQYHNGFIYLKRLCEMDKAHEIQLKSAIGRLFLQHGDLASAQEYFHEASELRTDSDSDQVDTLIDSSLILISQNSYPEALALLTQASHIQPDNFMILNNMAVCLLYLGKVKECLTLMETTVKQNIPQSLQENVLLNLSSIYELENADGTKKNLLLKIISEYKGDGINLASLKLPTLV